MICILLVLKHIYIKFKLRSSTHICCVVGGGSFHEKMLLGTNPRKKNIYQKKIRKFSSKWSISNLNQLYYFFFCQENETQVIMWLPISKLFFFMWVDFESLSHFFWRSCNFFGRDYSFYSWAWVVHLYRFMALALILNDKICIWPDTKRPI